MPPNVAVPPQSPSPPNDCLRATPSNLMTMMILAYERLLPAACRSCSTFHLFHPFFPKAQPFASASQAHTSGWGALLSPRAKLPRWSGGRGELRQYRQPHISACTPSFEIIERQGGHHSDRQGHAVPHYALCSGCILSRQRAAGSCVVRGEGQGCRFVQLVLQSPRGFLLQVNRFARATQCAPNGSHRTAPKRDGG